MTLFRCKVFLDHLQNKNLFRHVRQLHKSVPKRKIVQVDMTSERQVFQKVVSDVIDCAVSSPNIVTPEAKTWLREMLEYSMTDEIINTGVTVPIAYQMMEIPENITEKSLHDAHVLGWCVEMLQLYLILLDDILDKSNTRFGKPCWYKRPDVGPRALIDGILLHTSMIEVLQSIFGERNNYPVMIKAFNKAELITGIGQRLDYDSACKNNRHAIKCFTSENYHNIGVFKAAACITLQMELTCLLLKNSNIKMDTNVNHICAMLDKLLQITDDYNDVYHEDVSGCTSTDITEGKSSWIAVEAFQLANDNQKDVFCKYYGKEGPENVKRITQLYDELKMPEFYKNYRKTLLEDLKRQINNLPYDGMKDFFNFMFRVYKSL